MESLREELHISVEPAAAVHCKPVRSFVEANFPKNVLASCKCVTCAARVDEPAEPVLAAQGLQAAVSHSVAMLAHHHARYVVLMPALFPHRGAPVATLNLSAAARRL